MDIVVLRVGGRWQKEIEARGSTLYVSAWFAKHNEPTGMTPLPIDATSRKLHVPYSPTLAAKVGLHLIIQLRETTLEDRAHMRSKGTMTLGQTRIDLTRRDADGHFVYLVDSSKAVKIEFHNPWQMYDIYPIRAKIAIQGPHEHLLQMEPGTGEDQVCLSEPDFRTIHDWIATHSTTRFREEHKLHPFMAGAGRVFLDSLMLCGKAVPPWVFFTQPAKPSSRTTEEYFVGAMDEVLDTMYHLGVRNALVDLVLPHHSSLSEMLANVFLLAEPTGPISELPLGPEEYAHVETAILWLLQIAVRVLTRFAQCTLYDIDRTRVAPRGEVAIDDFDPARNKLTGPLPITGDCEDGAMDIDRSFWDLLALHHIQNPILRKMQAVLKHYVSAITLGITENPTPGGDHDASKLGKCFNAHMFVVLMPLSYMSKQTYKPHYGVPTAPSKLDMDPDQSIHLTPSDIRPGNRAGALAARIQPAASDACFHARVDMHRPSLYVGAVTMFFTLPKYPVQMEVMMKKGVFGCSLETLFRRGAGLVASGPTASQEELDTLYKLHGYLHPVPPLLPAPRGSSESVHDPRSQRTGSRSDTARHGRLYRPNLWFYINADSVQVPDVETMLAGEEDVQVERETQETTAGTIHEYSVYYDEA
jgi:hypothetical protein